MVNKQLDKNTAAIKQLTGEFTKNVREGLAMKSMCPASRSGEFLEIFEGEAVSTAKKIANIQPFNGKRDAAQTIYGNAQPCKGASHESMVLSEIWYMTKAGKDVPRSKPSESMLPSWPYPIMSDMVTIEQKWLFDQLPLLLRMTNDKVKATTACLEEMGLLISISGKIILTPVGQKLAEVLNPEVNARFLRS